MRLPIPVNIVTGALGVGKTTAISRLLSAKPAGETWAVLVNEFGSLGIDGALLESSPTNSTESGIVIKEIGGGCLCCTMSGPMGVAIAQLVRRAKPDRLIIEPSGLGHPAGLLDTLQNEHLKSALEVKAIICLVDIGQVSSNHFESNETYQDQVNMCDIIVGTKLDLLLPKDHDGTVVCKSSDSIRDSGADSVREQEACSLESENELRNEVPGADPLDPFRSWVSQLYPPKVKVLVISHGLLDLKLLDISRDAAYQPFFLGVHRVNNKQGGQLYAATSPPMGADVDPCTAEEPPVSSQKPEIGKPVRFLSEGSSQHVACGWLFSVDCLFNSGDLCKVLQALSPLTVRLKGVFRVGPKRWVVPQFSVSSTAEVEVRLESISYRRESRFEMIVTRPCKTKTQVSDPVKSECLSTANLNQMITQLPSWIKLGMWDEVESCFNHLVMK